MNINKLLKNINPIFLNGVAHRGLHNATITENSLESFKNAINNNVAFELDVHLTKDEKLIVCHDSNLLRTTGKPGIIEELTLDQIINDYKLFNGEKVPTLNEVLSINNEKVPIVIELKPYVKNKNYKLLANKVLSALEDIKDKRNIILISFYPQALLPFRNSGFMRCLLVDEKKSWTYIFRHFFEGVDLEWTLLTKKKYQKSLNKRITMCWTIEKEEQVDLVKKYCHSLTFQYLPLDLLKSSK